MLVCISRPLPLSYCDFPFFSGKEAHQHKQMCGIVLGLGGWKNFVYVFYGSFLMGEKKPINKIPPKISGQSRELFVFFFFCFFLIVRLLPGHKSADPSIGSFFCFLRVHYDSCELSVVKLLSNRPCIKIISFLSKCFFSKSLFQF